jgi:hypothetical protein
MWSSGLDITSARSCRGSIRIEGPGDRVDLFRADQARHGIARYLDIGGDSACATIQKSRRTFAGS